jgi:XRE family aerobic/anaerobic benzoate catabolism transcriptional regulator
MAGNREAMDDLKAILRTRTPFYAKADMVFDTSGKSADETTGEVLQALRVSGFERGICSEAR